jgi:hypothetical protein
MHLSHTGTSYKKQEVEMAAKATARFILRRNPYTHAKTE